MSSYVRQHRASDLSRFGHPIKTAPEKVRVRTADEGKNAAVRSSERATARVERLTLDDFGGRSDALGG